MNMLTRCGSLVLLALLCVLPGCAGTKFSRSLDSFLGEAGFKTEAVLGDSRKKVELGRFVASDEYAVYMIKENRVIRLEEYSNPRVLHQVADGTTDYAVIFGFNKQKCQGERMLVVVPGSGMRAVLFDLPPTFADYGSKREDGRFYLTQRQPDGSLTGWSWSAAREDKLRVMTWSKRKSSGRASRASRGKTSSPAPAASDQGARQTALPRTEAPAPVKTDPAPSVEAPAPATTGKTDKPAPIIDEF